MVELTHRIRKAYLLILVTLIIVACNDSKPAENYINAGKNYYNQTCLSCHLRGDNTLYQPSLEKMSQYETATLSELVLKLKSDSIHIQLLPAAYNTDTLISFIKSYKKQDIIPERSRFGVVGDLHQQLRRK